ncbi:MAG TPA: S8 family serine peptidase [Vicinamibacterales bacterium]|nr:S8 family serine peptidase [Vicinamibacterales bacterium]
MSRTRVFSCGVALIAGLITLGLRAQTTPATDQDPLGLRPNVGLPAIDWGVVADYTHTPATFETRRRAAIRSALHSDGVGSSGVPYARGKVIVKFRDEATPTARMNAVRSASPTGAITARPSYSNFDIVTIRANEDAEAVARLLGTRAEVAYAQPAYRVHTMFVPNDPLYKPGPNWGGQWNLPLIGLEQAWDIQPQAGSNITVAVLDTGMAYMNATLTPTIQGFVSDQGVQYPALGQATIPYSAATQLVRPERIVAPHDFIWDSDKPLDFDGHGTHVAGTIGQLTNDGIDTAGVAFNVKLMPVKVIDSMWDDLFGAPNSGTDATVAQGIRYAADNGAKVINMSIGRTGPPDTAPVVEDAVKYAVSKGVFIAIAAGNGYEEGNQKEVIADIASRVQGAVAVASVDRNALAGDGKCAGTATSPSCHAYYSSSGSWVELAAPGGSERGFGRDGYVWQQTFDFRYTETFLLPLDQYGPPLFNKIGIIGYIGTSQATPHVTGVAAMMMQQGITDPAAVEAALERFATDLGPPGRDDLYGYGLVNARNALRGLGIAR